MVFALHSMTDARGKDGGFPMKLTAMRCYPILLSLIIPVGCSNSSPSQEPDAGDEADVLGDSSDDDNWLDNLPDKCTAGTSWKPGQPAFREVTAEKGLIGVQGVRLSSADLDGDGFPELVVRHAGTNSDDFSEGGKRYTWVLKNDGGTRFIDITEVSGMLQRRAPNGLGRPAEIVVFADVNNDGNLDAFTAFSQGDTSESEGGEVMLNDGNARFAFGSETTPLRAAGQRINRASAVFTDFDRDGFIDIWMGNGAVNSSPRQNQLFRGDGTSEFFDVTADVGLITQSWSSTDILNIAEAHSNTWGATACDLNGDGVPELLAASYGRAPNHLWTGVRDGNGNVTFRNSSIASGYAFDHRADWTDNESARCYCKLNPTAADCEGVPEPKYIACNPGSESSLRWNHSTDREPYRLGGNSATTVCADINGDGHLDLLTTEIVHWDVGSSSDPSEILYNKGPQPDGTPVFDRPGNEATGLVRTHKGVDWNDGDMTAAVLDFDNDGRLDIYIGSSDYPGTRGWLFWQKPDKTFELVPLDVGIDSKASHGVTIADFDGDGDLDVVVGHSRARCGDQCYETQNVRYFENVMGQDGNWIQLKLEGGPGTNRAAIGARVTVRTPSGTQVREIGGGHGHYGIQDDLVVHFGLGTECTAEVEIRWPDGSLSVQNLTLKTGYRYHVRQGSRPDVVNLRP